MDFDKKITESLFKNYRYRLEISLADYMNKMDNASEQNLMALLKKANEYIENNSQLIDELCHKLVAVEKTSIPRKEEANKELVT